MKTTSKTKVKLTTKVRLFSFRYCISFIAVAGNVRKKLGELLARSIAEVCHLS